MLRTRVQQILDVTGGDRRVGVGAAIVVSAVFGAFAAWWTPRGPLTTTAALSTMLVGLIVGGAAGLAMRSRWAMLVAPLSFVVVFELLRIGATGPTVDRPLAFTTYGIMALVVGRGVHGLLVLLPMVLGASFGAAAARRRTVDPDALGATRPTVGVFTRRSLAALGTVVVVLLAAGIARPASTSAIVGEDGRRVEGSVAELTSVRIGGHDLGLMIRGHSVENPVILFLAGGPGGSEVGAMRRHLPMLEEDFVVVTFDQRGTGRSHHQLEPVSTLTLDNAVSDVLAVTEHLRQRFGVDQVVIVGQSWGTLLGMLAIDEAPELYSAFVGIGQMVSPTETDQIIYDDTLAWARAQGRDGLVEQLESIGRPPYDDILDYEPALSYEKDVYPYDFGVNSEGRGGFSENLFVGEYTLLEQLHALGGFLDVFSVLYPQLVDLDLREQLTRVEVPVFVMMGRFEAGGRAEPAEEWFAMLDAPHKEWIEFDTSGHRPLFEQPERFHEAMVERVLPLVSSPRT
jgi:proline iminopeptidase